MGQKDFYITTPIYYPNANLHMGHAYTSTICDILVRYHRLIGEKTYFLTGSDENSGKVVKSAQEAGKTVDEFLSEINENFKKLYSSLNISYDQFIRTTDKEKHWPGAIKMWNALVEAGDIYKSVYKGLYCQNCETFYTDKDLIDEKCPVHHTVPEKIEEENYFFKLSKYTDILKEKIESNEFEVVPQSRKNEILSLMNRGLEDISFSRPLATVPHGIPVPGDPSQVIYVWCDALVNYISALGYGGDETLFNKFWPADVHVIGKDILRFHTAIWPAMLLSAKLPLPKKVLVHGLIISGGQKMSKSLGNVIVPDTLIDEYGAEAVRYYLSRKVSTFEDSDLTPENFKDAYNSGLANGLGNLVSRIMKMAETHLSLAPTLLEETLPGDYSKAMESFNIQKASDIVWEKIGELDLRIQETQPFKLVKTDKEKALEIISGLVADLYTISRMLNPILPQASEIIQKLVKENRSPEKPLFARKD